MVHLRLTSSDVLLRHRRRCHPTPPPDQNHSPPTTSRTRSYPGVPISSSRNDSHSRDLSPGTAAAAIANANAANGHSSMDDYCQDQHNSHGHGNGNGHWGGGSRKHPREESGNSLQGQYAEDDYGDFDPHDRDDGERAVRARYGRDAYEDGSDPYGLRRAMRNELYDPATGDYYDQRMHGEDNDRLHGNRGHGNGDAHGGADASASYTPHLLPIFQHQHHSAQNGTHGTHGAHGHQRSTSGGGQMSDPHHLEDASVLLSMAYGLDTDKPPSTQSHHSQNSQQSQGKKTSPVLAGSATVAADASGNTPSATDGRQARVGNVQGGNDKVQEQAQVQLESMDGLFGDISWMANSVNPSGPSKGQVEGVSSDWVSLQTTSSSGLGPGYSHRVGLLQSLQFADNNRTDE